MSIKTNKMAVYLERLRLLAIFAMLGSLMFVSDILMEFLPNMHIVGALMMIYTVVYRAKALIPLYVYVFLNGLFGGGIWWYPYLYVWLPLWALTMLVPRSLGAGFKVPIYMLICALHGFCFGILYAPFQTFAFGLDFESTVMWIAAGLPFDIIHGVFNFVAATLVLPVSSMLMKLENRIRII